MFAQRTTRQIYHYDLVENQFHNSTRLPTRRSLSTAKYVPYKQDHFRTVMPCYVCDVKYPILSASRLLDRGYGLDFNPRRCAITHGEQQAHLIRHSGHFCPRAEKIDIRAGFDIYPMTTDNGKPIAVIQQQQEQIAPHTQTKDCDRSLVETLTTGNLMVTTPPGFTKDHAKRFQHHTAAAAQHQKKN